MPSVSLSVPRAVLTALSEPEIVSTSLLPLFTALAPPAVTDSRPLLSATVTVKVSPLVGVAALRQAAAGDQAALPTPIVSAVGAVITGSPFTVTASSLRRGVAEAVGRVDRDGVGPRRAVGVAQRAQVGAHRAQRPGDRQLVLAVAGSASAPVTDSTPLLSARSP